MEIQEELFRRAGGREKVLGLSDFVFVPYKNDDNKYGYKLNNGDIIY